MAEDVVNVVIQDKKTGLRKTLNLKINGTENIEDLTKNVEKLTLIPSNELEAVFCGKMLSKSTIMKDLSLTPATQIMLLRPQKTSKENDLNIEKRSEIAESTTLSSFFVWCKTCEKICQGKLRVYCQNCKSTSVLVKTEPQNWFDVLKSKRISVNCEDCCASDIFAEFKFKCKVCNDVAPVLTHIRGNWQLQECCICDAKEKIVLDLGCNHINCSSCFNEYLRSLLEVFNFVNRPPYGFTVECPYPGCKRVVKDVHHFHIMGRELYSEYQRKATERLIAIDDEGVTCPNPSCGQSFFWEPYDDDGRSQCPDCFYSFCRKCTEKQCVCKSDEDLTKNTIEATTRRCPRCNAATERNGGCAHIHCTSCGMDWCFKCVAEWKEECQWDHWFH